MLKRILNAIGDWNPQLLREWQGRFKPWDVTGAFAVSAIVQFIFMTQRQGLLPRSYTTNYIYCTGANVASPNATAPAGTAGASYPAIHHDPLCLKDAADNVIVNWHLWWHDNFVPLTQFLLGGVIVAGVYWLISDLIFEERRGTLNFVRLSPRSGKEILWGKLLGVPTLVYVALAAALPLHWYAAVQGQIPLDIFVGTYVVGTASCLFFLSGALLWSMTTSVLGYLQPWAGAGFAAMTVWVLMSAPFPFSSEDPLNWLWLFEPSTVVKHLTERSYPRTFQSMTWLGLTYNASPLSTTLVTTAYLSLWTYWIWQALLRRFHNARGTVLSKKQSYIFTICLIGSLAGFARNNYSSTALNMSLIICLVMVTLITPNRQTLHEWARYRHQMPKETLMSELLWGEKSPALLAVAVNMAIAVVLLSPAILMTANTYLNGVLQLVALAIVVLMLAALFQIMLLLKAPRPELWAVGSWIGCWLFPVMAMALLDRSNVVWAVSIAPWLAVHNTNTTIATILGTLATQLSIFGLLTHRLMRQLDRAAASESKALLT
jgi:hypothetical protein